MTGPNNNVSEINPNHRIYEIYPHGRTSFTTYDDDGVNSHDGPEQQRVGNKSEPQDI